MQLEGKVALVTGSNRGIGRGIAVEFAREGADVIVNYRTHAGEAEAVAEEVRAHGRKALVCQADVSDRATVEGMVAAGVEAFGRIDICVSNAALSIRKPFLEIEPEAFRKVVDVSLFGVFHTCQLCAREMVKQGDGGAILVVSSVHSFIPFNECIAYNTCKAGINNMSNTMADELRGHRIRVNVLEPGWIDTPGERDRNSDETIAAQAKNLPWGRLGTIDETGRAAVFLCSPRSDYVTAANLRVDGGFWLPSRSGSSVQ